MDKLTKKDIEAIRKAMILTKVKTLEWYFSILSFPPDNFITWEQFLKNDRNKPS